MITTWLHWSSGISAAPKGTGRFGGWLNGKWSCYPQIACSHCAPRKQSDMEIREPEEAA